MVSGEEHGEAGVIDVAGMAEDKREALLDRLLAILSAARLETVGAKVQVAKQEREEAERKDLVAAIERYKPDAARLGLELIIRRVAGKSGANKAKRKSQPGTKGRRYPAGTYRNPETGALWQSGGRPPQGIRRAVAAGRDPSEFLVKEEAGPPVSASGE